ncbi:MAG: single-stranded DNA-binding protein [Acidobacteriota bacterium]|nr:single-stranded DNA-binding protein [Acidobacteriota bacterium]
MGKCLNKVFLLGHVGKDPEVHALNSGTLVNVRLATTKPMTDNRGDRYEKTEWHNLVGHGRHVEVFRDYVRKGSRILVEGELSTRSWGDQTTGGVKYRTEVIVHQLTLLSYATSWNESDRASEPDAYFVGLPEITEQQVPY